MLSLTPDAAEHLNRLLEESGAPDDTAARFIAGPDGLALHLDRPRPGDETVEHHGRTLLLMDEQVSELLDDRTLDLEQTEQGPEFTLQ